MTDFTPDPGGPDDIFATTEYEPTSPPSREFKPWHRPRKQFVRSKQWLEQTSALASDLPVGAPLNYLGLPGDDLLDIRAIHHACCTERRLRFLGFNTAAGGRSARTDLEISLQEVKALANVDEQSTVIPDDIRSLGQVNSMGQKAVRDAGPFDVVNLDLCNNFLTEDVGDGSIYDAISALFGLQNRRKHPWLLFLTTRVDRATVEAGICEKLDALLTSNLETCDGFAQALRGLLGGRGHRLPDDEPPPVLATCPDGQWLDMYCVALSKWILSRALAHDTKFEVKSTMSYRVASGSGDDDLVSLAFRLTPSLQAAPDSAGIAGTPDQGLNECDLATRIPRRAAARLAVDTILAGDEALRDRMIEATSELLQEARYAAWEYLEWAMTPEQSGEEAA